MGLAMLAMVRRAGRTAEAAGGRTEERVAEHFCCEVGLSRKMYLEMVEGGEGMSIGEALGWTWLNDDKFLAGTDGFTELAWSSAKVEGGKSREAVPTLS